MGAAVSLMPVLGQKRVGLSASGFVVAAESLAKLVGRTKETGRKVPSMLAYQCPAQA